MSVHCNLPTNAICQVNSLKKVSRISLHCVVIDLSQSRCFPIARFIEVGHTWWIINREKVTCVRIEEHSTDESYIKTHHDHRYKRIRQAPMSWLRTGSYFWTKVDLSGKEFVITSNLLFTTSIAVKRSQLTLEYLAYRSTAKSSVDVLDRKPSSFPSSAAARASSNFDQHYGY